MIVPVRLKYATSQAFAVGGVSEEYTFAKITVQNLAFEKSVVMHRRSYDGTWSDTDLDWLANYGDHDLFRTKPAPPYTEEFVIKYGVNGETFWDNNKGANFHVPNFTNVIGGNVILSQAAAHTGTEAGGGFVFTTSWMEGEIYVNNLSFAKNVGVWFSVDGGVRWNAADASYGGAITEQIYASTSGAEVWKFKTPEYNLDPASSVFQFAVYYRNLDSGEMFWDNNFGQNYHLAKTDGTLIE
jgi:hypothetical protein